MDSFKDKIALVTGASRGLGASVAQAFANEGAHVIAVARTIGALEELDDMIQAKGGQCTLVPLDLTDEKAIQSMCLSIHERWGGEVGQGMHEGRCLALAAQHQCWCATAANPQQVRTQGHRRPPAGAEEALSAAPPSQAPDPLQQQADGAQGRVQRPQGSGE